MTLRASFTFISHHSRARGASFTFIAPHSHARGADDGGRWRRGRATGSIAAGTRGVDLRWGGSMSSSLSRFSGWTLSLGEGLPDSTGAQDRIRSVIDQVEVDDTEIRIVDRRQVLERLMTGGGHLRPECPVLSGSGAPEEMRTPDPRFVVTSYDYRLDIGQSPQLYHGQDTSVRLLGGAALGRPSDRVPCRAVAHSIPCAASFRMAGVGALGSRAYKQDWTYSKAAENRVMDTGHVAKACLYCRQKSRNILILLSADPSRRERQWSRDAEAGG